MVDLSVGAQEIQARLCEGDGKGYPVSRERCFDLVGYNRSAFSAKRALAEERLDSQVHYRGDSKVGVCPVGILDLSPSLETPISAVRSCCSRSVMCRLNRVGDRWQPCRSPVGVGF